jgi:hypothetical protein
MVIRGPENICVERLKDGTEIVLYGCRMLSNIINQCLNGHPVSDQRKVFIYLLNTKKNRKRIQVTIKEFWCRVQ